MKKVIHATAVYGPIALCGVIVLFLLLLVFGWMFVPYNGYVWCGVSAAICLFVCFCVKADYDGRSIPKIEDVGLLLFASLNSAWWVYIWSTVKYTLLLPFAVICTAFILYLILKLCDDTVKRTRGLMVGSALAIVGFIIWFVPVLQPPVRIKDRFSVYNNHSAVAKVLSIRDAGNIYNISVVVKKTGFDLGLGRFEGLEEIGVFNKIIDLKDYKKPALVWQGEELFINGEKRDIYWK